MLFVPAVGWKPALQDITINDDGDSTLESSGGGTTSHTHNSETSAGPHSYALITWDAGGNSGTLSGATWGGVSMSIFVQINTNDIGAAIAYIAGAQTGNIVLTFSANATHSAITKVSLSNVASPDTPVDIDSDSETSASNGTELAALSSPGAGGIRLAVTSNDDQATAFTWSNATEISDFSATTIRHSAAYDLGDDGASINPTGGGGTDDEAIVGVSLR